MIPNKSALADVQMFKIQDGFPDRQASLQEKHAEYDVIAGLKPGYVALVPDAYKPGNGGQ